MRMEIWLIPRFVTSIQLYGTIFIGILGVLIELLTIVQLNQACLEALLVAIVIVVGVAILTPIFLGNRKIMATFDPESKDIREVRFIYTIDDQIASFQQQLAFSSPDDEEKVILETFTLAERANMAASDAYFISSFYFYLPTIREVEVRLPFSSFVLGVIKVLNMVPSQIIPNGWSLIKAFEIIFQRLRVYPTT